MSQINTQEFRERFINCCAQRVKLEAEIDKLKEENLVLNKQVKKSEKLTGEELVKSNSVVVAKETFSQKNSQINLSALTEEKFRSGMSKYFVQFRSLKTEKYNLEKENLLKRNQLKGSSGSAEENLDKLKLDFDYLASLIEDALPTSSWNEANKLLKDCQEMRDKLHSILNKSNSEITK